MKSVELSAVDSHRPAFSSSATVSSSAVSSEAASDKYQMIKQLISNPSLFTPAPLPTSDVTSDGSSVRLDQGWSSVDDQNGLDAGFQPFSSANDGDWADFQGTSVTGVSDSSQSVPDTAADFGVKTKLSTTADLSSATSWFGIRQNTAAHSKPTHALFSSRALDFSPPEFPPDNEDEETNDLDFYSVHSGDIGQGISSLSTLDLEEESVDAVRNSGGLLKPGIHGLTTSNSASSLEFTGWQLGLKSSLPARSGDSHSMNSLDLLPMTDAPEASPNRSPSQPTAEPDSQSENSFEYVPPPSETRLPPHGIAGADCDAASLQSFELKTTLVSPEEEPSSRVGRDDSIHVTWSLRSAADGSQSGDGMHDDLSLLSDE